MVLELALISSIMELAIVIAWVDFPALKPKIVLVVITVKLVIASKDKSTRAANTSD